MDNELRDMSSTEPATGETGGQVNQIVSRAGELAGQTVEQAQRLGATARERLVQEADDKKGRVARRLGQLADDVEGLGGSDDDLQKRLVGGAAQAMRRVSRTLEERSTEELLASAGRSIRRHPGLLLAGCVALGFLGGRLLKR
jgi:hypothetical protein